MVRNYHKVDVIGHETVSPDVATCFWFCSSNELKICQVIFYVKKSFLSSVSSLGDMMGVTGNNQPGDTGHCESQQ